MKALNKCLLNYEMKIGVALSRGNQKGIYYWVWAMFVFRLLPDASLQQLVTRSFFVLLLLVELGKS